MIKGCGLAYLKGKGRETQCALRTGESGFGFILSWISDARSIVLQIDPRNLSNLCHTHLSLRSPHSLICRMKMYRTESPSRHGGRELKMHLMAGEARGSVSILGRRRLCRA